VNRPAELDQAREDLVTKIETALEEGARAVVLAGPAGSGKAAAVCAAMALAEKKRGLRHLQVDYSSRPEGAIEGIRTALAQLLGYAPPAPGFPWRSTLGSWGVDDPPSIELTKELLLPAEDEYAEPPGEDRPVQVAQLVWRVFSGAASKQNLGLSLLSLQYATEATLELLGEVFKLLAWRPVPLSILLTVDKDVPEAKSFLKRLDEFRSKMPPGRIAFLEGGDLPKIDVGKLFDEVRSEVGREFDMVMRAFAYLGPRIPAALISEFARRAWSGKPRTNIPIALEELEKRGVLTQLIAADGKTVVSLRRSVYDQIDHCCRYGKQSFRRIHGVIALSEKAVLFDTLDRGQRTIGHNLQASTSPKRAHQKLLASARIAVRAGDWQTCAADLEAASEADQETAKIRHDKRVERGILQAIALLRMDLSVKARLVVEETYSQAREVGDQWGMARTFELLAEIEQKTGSVARAIDEAERSLARYDELDDRGGMARLLTMLGLLVDQGNGPAAARPYLERALFLWERLDEPSRQAETITKLAYLMITTGETAETLTILKRAEHLCSRTGDLVQLGRVHNTLGILYNNLGDFEQASRHYLRCVDITRNMGFLSAHAMTLHNLSLVWVELGQPGRARDMAKEAYELYKEQQDLVSQAKCLNAVAVAEARDGYCEAATRTCEEGLEIAREAEAVRIETALLATQGSAHLAAGHVGEAVMALEQSTQKGRELGMETRGRGTVLRDLGDAYQALDREEEAREAWREAKKLAQQAGDSALKDEIGKRIDGVSQTVRKGMI